MKTSWDAEPVEVLLDDMDLALRELTGPPQGDLEGWARGPVGKWTAGQHVDHVGRVLGIAADRLEANAAELRAGKLGKRPWRDPLQAWFVGLVTREPFPRGGRSPRRVKPGVAPEHDATLRAVQEGAARHRRLTVSLTPDEGRRLWIWNPFVPIPWHYTLHELLRVHANHARHHARLAQEAARAIPGISQ
jgi:hypothetical protein